MVCCIDIDGTICNIVDVPDYGKSEPYIDRISKINKLYDEGNSIILWTGRHWNHLKITIEQLKRWGVKYHTLIMGKPAADIYVDDKAVGLKFFEVSSDK